MKIMVITGKETYTETGNMANVYWKEEVRA